MKKRLAAILLPGLLSCPLIASADSGAGCGLGQQIWAGQSGLAPHVLAATTNGTSFNQLFGLSFDSLGCNGTSTVTAEYQRNLYVASNLDNIARDAARGGGDHLQSLAELLAIEEGDQPAFYAMTQSRYDALFGSTETSSKVWLSNLDQAMLAEPRLSRYAGQ